MKRWAISLMTILITLAPLFGDAVKKSRSEVTFKTFGTFKSEQTEKISRDKKIIDTDNSFKGKGLLGKAAAKTVLKAGQSFQIIDLPSMVIFDINHKKKTYTTRDIVPLESGETSQGVKTQREEGQESESRIRVIRNEFKVEKTGDRQTVNAFPVEKYVITWIYEWEDTQTGRTGKDSLLTEVWTTPMTGELTQAREEEKSFSQAHMKALGFELDELQQSMLGSNWMTLFSQMGGESQSPSGSNISSEMAKIEGYPVVIDGKYFSTAQGGEEEEESSGKGVKKLLGGLAKKALKKKKSGEDEPALVYRTELIEFLPTKVDASEFTPPAGYAKKSQ